MATLSIKFDCSVVDKIFNVHLKWLRFFVWYMYVPFYNLIHVYFTLLLIIFSCKQYSAKQTQLSKIYWITIKNTT